MAKTNDENGEAIGTNNDARVAKLNAIGDNVDRKRADELRDVVNIDQGLTEEFTVDEPSAEEQAAREAEVQRQSHDATTADELARMEAEANQGGDEEEAESEQPVAAAQPVKHKVKLGGKEVELTTEELIARATQVEDANTYLSEAQRIRDEAQRQPNKEEPRPSAEEQAAARKEKLRERARAIQMGTEDEVMEALEAMEHERGGQQLDLSTVSKAVDERMAFTQAVEWVQDEYKDLFADSELKSMLVRKEADLVKSGDKRPYKERYKAIGDEIRGWVKKFQPEGASSAAPANLEQRRDAKRQASKGAPPAAAAQRANLGEEDDNQPENPSTVIAKMAETRGGSQRMRS